MKDDEPTEGGRRRSGRLAKARSVKKNVDEDEETSCDRKTPCLATSSQSNTPMASPLTMSPMSDQINNGENANHNNRHCSSSIPLPVPSSKQMPLPPRPVISIPKETEPTPPFTPIDDNVYLFDRKRSKNHRDIRKMVCDCILTKEERQRGFTGCGEDCLNRILMIECGSRCPVGNDCANKRFQKKQYVKCEPFRAGKKGWGLRVLERVEPGTFIMEYIGEVVDPSEFKSRVRKHAKEKKEHHYFMALKSDEIIDATSKGNITRFINHSCEPSCETQKWTVNGDLRVGFFSIRTLEPGDEVTFNYQFERYGKKAQPCYCETSSCQGVIGGTGTSKIAIDGTRFTTEELEDIKEYDEILEHDKDAFEDFALEAEIEKLCEAGYLRNKRQVMTLARIMLRTEENDDRMKLLKILDETKEPVFRRLFLDYHGLRLLWSWMVESNHIFVKAGILQVLSVLPIPNRTVLLESKVMEVVERWSTEPDPVPSSPLPKITDTKPEISNEDQSSAAKTVTEVPSLQVEEVNVKAESEEANVKSVSADAKEETKEREPVVPVVDDLGGFEEETSTPVVERAKIKITIISKKEEKKDDAVKLESTELPPPPNIAAIARKLLQMWKNLKEAYKIPRLILKNRKDDELAADAFEEAEKKAKDEVVQDKKSIPDLKPRPYDWIIAPLRSKPCDKTTDFMNQVNGQDNVVIDDGPRESKVAHRMNFEMELLKEKYEREMEALRTESEETKRQLQMMAVQQSSLASVRPIPNIRDTFSGMLQQDVVNVASESYSFTDDSIYTQPVDYESEFHAGEYEYDMPEDTSRAYEDEMPKVTVDNLANVVIECTPRNLHTLRSDEEAVVSVDYGIEYIPRKRRRPAKRDLFDPSFPAPGIYFEFGSDNIYYTSCWNTLDGSCDFEATPTSIAIEVVPSEEEIAGPLPPNWRRARDEKAERSYFFHKKKLETRWRLPDGPSIVRSNADSEQEPKIKSESIVATADSTSCVGTGTATNSPATSSCMNSPLGIFYKPAVNGLKNETCLKETPDQSSHKKSRRKKPNLEKFKSEVSEMVKKFLYPYQKEECPVGKIVTPEDFKHLCKKFTNEIYAKEVKSGKTDLIVNETVKRKSKGYVKKYMATRGPVFRLGHSPAQEVDNSVSCIMTNDEDVLAEDEGNDEFNEGAIS